MKDLKNQQDVKVGIVLLNWNGGEYTIPCIESLLAGESKPWRILVWDNASNDGSPDQITARFSSVQIVRSKANDGFARANNLGAAELLRDGADYIWFLNNDTIVAPKCMGALLEAMEGHPHAAAATGKILYADPPDLIWYAGGGCPHWTLHSYHRGIRKKDRGQYDQADDVQFISGCCMFIRREAIESCGLFDERYFAYDEDVDWCLRARQGGCILWYEPGAVLWHRVSASLRKNTLGLQGGRVSAQQHYLLTRNRLFTIRRHARHSWQFISALAWLLFGRVLISGGLLIFRRSEKLRALWRGMADGWRTSVDGVFCGQETVK